MDRLNLTLEQRALQRAAVRRRVHELRNEALAGAIDAARVWLRRRFATQRTTKEAVCRS